jgi:hypothetical protein
MVFIVTACSVSGGGGKGTVYFVGVTALKIRPGLLTRFYLNKLLAFPSTTSSIQRNSGLCAIFRVIGTNFQHLGLRLLLLQLCL